MMRQFFGAAALVLGFGTLMVAMSRWEAAPVRPPLPDSPLAAAQFRYRQRLSEDGTTPHNALMQAIEQRTALLAAQGLRDPRPMASGTYPGGWTWLGPGNVGGRIRAILIDPGNPSVMYVGAASGGIWKTTNGGTLWSPLDDFMPTLAIGCMAMDPGDSSVLYAGTGEGFFETEEGSSNTAAVRGAGIFRSTDAGANWTQIPSTTGSDWYFVNRIAVDPSNGQRILAATTAGIFRSLDGGTSWAKVFSGFVYDVRFHPSDGSKAVAGLHDSGGLYSNDGGATWTAAAGLAGHRTELRYAPGNPTIVYAALSENDRITLYRSTDGGQSYALRTVGSGIQTYSAYNSTLWVDPTNSDRVIFGGVFLFRSTDGGANASQTFNGVHADMHAIVSHPAYNGTTNRTVFFGTDGGIYRTTDAQGSSATGLNNNLGITQWYGATMNLASGKIVAGAQDNGTKLYSGNPQAWTNLFGGDGGYTAADPSDPNYLYGEVQWAFVFRSSNNGGSAGYIWNHTNPLVGAGTTQFNFIPYLMLDPNESNRMYVGGRLLWRSNNVKATSVDWTSIKPTIQPGGRPDGPGGAHFAPNPPWNISTIAVAPGNSNLIYVGYNNGEIWKTSNGLNAAPNWIRIDDVGGPMPARWVSKIVIDPTDSSRAYATFMGWAPDNVWRTTNGGGSWTEIGGTAPFRLPSAPASTIAKHPLHPWLYVGTDIGLFFSADDGASWMATNSGPGIVPVEELHWLSASRLMMVTHGRGVYVTDLEAPDIPFSPDGYAVQVGSQVSGRLQEMFGSDDRRLAIDSAGLRGRVLVTGASPITAPSMLKLTFEGQTSFGGEQLTVALRNWLTGSFEKVMLEKLTTADGSVTVTVSGLPLRFVHPVTRKVEASVNWAQRDTLGGNSRLGIDQVLFVVRS